MEMLGITSPDDMVDFMGPMTMNMTPEDYASMGIPLMEDPHLLDGVDTKEVIRVAADEMMDYCGF